MKENQMVSEKRKYRIINTEQAKEVTGKYLVSQNVDSALFGYGLPEVHDRYHVWNVPVIYCKEVIGTVSIDAFSGEINKNLSTDISILEGRINKIKNSPHKVVKKVKGKKFEYIVSSLKNTIAKGRAELVLRNLPEQSIDMIFTSPPYYNARKEYSEYETYEDYLDVMREVIRQCRRVLIDGKFFIMNSSHVLVPRASRSESSSRIPVPFDLHQIFMEEGFEFIDDIIWQKPEGAGWASGRGRRFSADRNPMQYKAVPVTEYVMVYRKKPAGLIDDFIRKHPVPELVEDSKIEDGYETTNVWYISPARDKRHPAIFPNELAEKVIKYYSFKNDVVLDPFGGIGTTAKCAAALKRRFYSIEMNDEYIEAQRSDIAAKQNLLNDFYSVEYVDYSREESITIPKSLRHFLAELRESGISDEEIIEKLK